jgi:hypothetical protein
MKAIIVSVLVFSISSLSYAEDNTPIDSKSNRFTAANEPYFNGVLGISPEAVLGFEYQKGHHVFGVGIPGAISYKWFKNPYANSKFYSVYIGGFNNAENNEVVDDVFYKKYKTSFVGAGIGYRWQWQSGFNVTTSIALHYSKNEFSNPNSSTVKKESSLFPFPGVVVGYKF